MVCLRFKTPGNSYSLEYGINIQVIINVQVGYFLQNNKHTGLNKRTGGNFQSKNLTLLVQFYVKQLKGKLPFSLDLRQNSKN